MEIRELEPERDASACAGLIREAAPAAVVTPESWLHQSRTIPASAGLAGWVAVDAGAVVGAGWAFRTLFSAGATTAWCSVTVTASRRRRGIGSALFERVEAHAARLGRHGLIAAFDENPAGVSFAASRGFAEVRAEATSLLDVQAFDGAVPPELDFRPLSQCDARDAWLVDVEATRDMPTTEPIDDLTYEEWAPHVVEHPLLTHDGSFLAYVGDEPAAVSLLIADPSWRRSANMFTGTRRAFRGRGLGSAAKIASILWARQHGIETMATRNDETNAPMLAINRKLGFVPAARRVEWLRAGTASSPAPRAPAQ